MSGLKIAVVLLNWNSISDTSECIESIISTHGDHVSVYVVDNASRGNEGLQLAQRFPSVNVLIQTENHGFCKGNNIGIAKAIDDGASYIMMLNNDTIVPPGAIDIMVEQFNSLPDCGALSPVILEYPAVDTVWFARAEWDSSRAQFSLDPDKKTYEQLQKQKPWKSEFACGCCLVSSAEIFKQVGLLDERYFAYYDEAEWCKRLEKKGYSSYVIPSTHIYHKVSRTTPGLVATYLLTRNRKLWMKENLSLSERKKSFSYLTKELLWHYCNSKGLVKGTYSRKHSKALVRGWIDFKFRRFGKWSKQAEKIIFPSK